MWKCPVCGKENQTMLCSCGFDESLNYAKYPTLMAIGSDIKPVPSREPEQQEKDEPVAEPKNPVRPGGKKILFATIALAITFLLVLCIATLPKPESEDHGTSLPTMRIMAGDCSTLLSDAGLSGAVLELQVQSQELNERFMVLTVICAAEVLEDGQQKEYVVELLYEYEDDTWHLSSLSNVRQ